MPTDPTPTPTPREIAEGIVERFLSGRDGLLHDAITAALTAERERAEQAERERAEALGIAEEAVAIGTAQATEYDRFWSALGVCDEAISVDDAVVVAHALVAERDTLRQREAVLRAEVRAGRKARRRWHSDGCPGAAGCTCRLSDYDTARAATDAVLGTEVARGELA